MTHLWEIFGYMGALITGVSLGLIGGGGSILIVPVLVYLFGIAPALATAYSLFTVGTASIVGAYQYARKGLLDYRTAVIFAIPSFVGVFLVRKFLVPALPDSIIHVGAFEVTKDMLIMLVFAFVMLFASVSMIRKKSDGEEADETDKTLEYNYKMIAIEGLGVGAVTGFVGAGGGFLIIPALVLFAKLPMKLAVGTSLSIIAVKSLFGFLGDVAADQQIEWPFLLLVTCVSIVGIFVGSYISKFIPGKKLKPAFGWFVFVIGFYILLRQVL